MPISADRVGMVRGNAPMYIAGPRIAGKVSTERTTLEDMGGADMHACVSGCGGEVFDADWQVIAAARLPPSPHLLWTEWLMGSQAVRVPTVIL